MRTTLNIDEEILKKASFLSGIKEKTTLIHMGLEALIARERGSEKKLSSIPRRRD